MSEDDEESEGSDMDGAVPSPVVIDESPEKPQVQASYAAPLAWFITTLHHVHSMQMGGVFGDVNCVALHEACLALAAAEDNLEHGHVTLALTMHGADGYVWL